MQHQSDIEYLCFNARWNDTKSTLASIYLLSIYPSHKNDRFEY